MKSYLPAAALTLLFAAAAAAQQPATPPAPPTTKVSLNGHNFTLPAGFTIELVAGPPLADRPITAAFDEQGRLYVADSSGSNEKVKVQLEKKPHRVVRLEDRDGDGKFDKSTVFADRMMFPEGTMWLDGSLYVAAPPVIWKLTDTDDDGVADRREEWFDGKTLNGCANDLHGPYAGPDGWVYWCKGAFEEQTYERPGQAPFVTHAAHIFRARRDGSNVEPVMTGGMDNPVDVIFTPGGERVFTTTFLQFPGGGKRDGLLHNVYGGLYGKDFRVIHEPAHKWTGPHLMPVLSHLGPAAPAGLARAESDAFGPDYRHSIYACNFNLQKVTRHTLTPDGATFRSVDTDFVASDNKDFHPTDVFEDADGSIIVVDTGGWYKLCCPTSQLQKPDILGGIYRVRRADAKKVGDPRGLRLAWDRMTVVELARHLEDDRPAVRQRAIRTLSRRDPQEVLPLLAELLRSGPTAEVRRNAVWTASHIGNDAALATLRVALKDGDETVRQAALHCLAAHRDRHALAPAQDLLRAPSWQNRRAAAELLGRIGDKQAVPALLAAAAGPDDHFLQHSITYALIEIADRVGTAAGLTSTNPLTRRAALVALDQMESGGLRVATVLPELAASDPKLKETAWWVASRHPEWGEELAGVLRQRLAKSKLTDAGRDELVGLLARFAGTPTVQRLLADQVRDGTVSPQARLLALRAMAQAELKEAPALWLTALVAVLAVPDADLRGEAVTATRLLRLPKQPPQDLTAVLHRLGTDATLSAAVRLNALAAVPGGLTKVDAPLLAFLRAQLAPDQPVMTRSLAADVLSRAALTTPQLLELTGSLAAAGPMEVERLLDAYQKSKDDAVGVRLLQALTDSPVRSALRAETLKPRLAHFGPSVQKEAEKLYAALNVTTGEQQARLEQLLAHVKDGDIRRGQLVFNSAKAACASCHAIGYLGGKVGPDLTRIGQIRTERDLLEAIAFPSASFVRSYEPVLVVTASGQAHNGLVKRETADEVVLTVGADQEVRVPRADIEEMQPGRVSVMPAGLDQQLTPQELADLVTFLRACR